MLKVIINRYKGVKNETRKKEKIHSAYSVGIRRDLTFTKRTISLIV